MKHGYPCRICAPFGSCHANYSDSKTEQLSWWSILILVLGSLAIVYALITLLINYGMCGGQEPIKKAQKTMLNPLAVDEISDQTNL